MKYVKHSAVILLFLIAMPKSCSIIFEEDLSGEIIYILMPADGTETNEQDQLFWWEPVEDALEYNLQIVKGSFFEPLSFVADTNISDDKYRIDLDPGEYEWRIQGRNDYSATDYFYSLLSIRDTTEIDEK
jgi:hypothetical protein